MKSEKILISIVAMIIGITVAGLGFYFYQSQKTIPNSQIKTISLKTPTPTPKPGIFITIDSPQNEAVVDTKTVTVTGRTVPDATVVIVTDSDQDVVTPAANGNFSSSVNISNGENIMEVTAILPNGQQASVNQTITYSTEEF